MSSQCPSRGSERDKTVEKNTDCPAGVKEEIRRARS